MPNEYAHLFKGGPGHHSKAYPDTVKIIKDPIIKRIHEPVEVHQPVQIRKAPLVTKMTFNGKNFELGKGLEGFEGVKEGYDGTGGQDKKEEYQ